MKKLSLLLLAAVVALFLAGCEHSAYIYDGEFMAYEVTVSSNAPMVTYVTVTIEDGQIVDYNLDARQGIVTETTVEDTTSYNYSWKEMTKKELAFEYGMKLYGTRYELIDGAWVEKEELKPEYEWHEQMQLIEAFLLEYGHEEIELIDDRFANIAGATIHESGYIDLVAEALEMAKEGIVQAIHCTGDDLYIASAHVNRHGKFYGLDLDMLQGQPNGETFAWSTKTKQELGDEYGMKGMGSTYEYIDGKWIQSDEKTSLEWYEQANLITDYIEANGWNPNLSAIEERGATIDGNTLVDDLAGVTIRSQALYDVLEKLFAKIS